MKLTSWLALLVLVLAGTSPANADTPDAILRCDPGTLIKKIDGSGKGYKMAGHGASFIECEARAYIDSHHPELAGRLEAAPFREARSPNICRGMGFDLSVIP